MNSSCLKEMVVNKNSRIGVWTWSHRFLFQFFKYLIDRNRTNFLFCVTTRGITGRAMFFVCASMITLASCQQVTSPRQVIDFNFGWKFHLGEDSLAYQPDYDDGTWRRLRLPHDWSIEGTFSDQHHTRPAGGALPAGKGWYRKSFVLPESDGDKNIYLDFGGVYRNSDVWINGHHLGKRPFGYISFQYDISSHLHFGERQNVVAVKVDNTPQPNSRWYTGSGIYRGVKLVKTSKVQVSHWGTFVTTPQVTADMATVAVAWRLANEMGAATYELRYSLKGPGGAVLQTVSESVVLAMGEHTFVKDLEVSRPKLWSVDQPHMHALVISIAKDGQLLDEYVTPFGIRYYDFDVERGFSLNGQPLKIHGVNQHHDLGALGAAFNKRAARRQLELLQDMGVNGIRMAHNPPAEELLDLCDEMGFIVIDEAFDEWKKTKAREGYHLHWDEWHERDLQDMVLRDRNHPSIFIWSIGNEIREQFDSSGIGMTQELAAMVRALDTTRMITSGLTENEPAKNFIAQSGALDLLSFNYKQEAYEELPHRFPNVPMLASETSSAFATRGHYDMPSDSVQRWPAAYKKSIPNANPDYTVSAYDMISAYWGSTHEETWRVVKRLDHMAGIYVWSGFDYLGEPEPYPYPARSAYLGVIDLAGFPKDAYYMYQSEWSPDTMLHLFPHWNWAEGQAIDVWAYYNHAEEAELFLNGVSQGVRRKSDSVFHVQWRLNYRPGTIQVVTRNDGKTLQTQSVETAGAPERLALTADRATIAADAYDLSFVTVEITDAAGHLAPHANNLVRFDVTGPATIVGTDNGYQASLESFKAPQRKAWKGKCLVIVQSTKQAGEIVLKASSEGLAGAEIRLVSQ